MIPHASTAVTKGRALLTLQLLLVALVCSLPHWAGLLANHGDYTPFSASPAVSAITFDETHAYAPPARRFLQTGKLAAETDNYEYRDRSGAIPVLPPILLGSLGRLVGSLEWAFILADCLFPPLIFLLLYKFAGSSLLIAWATLLIPFNLLNSIWLGTDARIAPLEITRTPQPEISFFFLLAAVLLLGRALEQPSNRTRTVLAGIASAAVIYCYFFYAIAWTVTLLLLLLLGSIWKSRPLSRVSGFVLSISALLSLPFASAALHGKAQGGQTALLSRMGAFTHRPDLLALAAALVLTALLATTGKQLYVKKPAFFILCTLIAGAFFGMNAQILTGFETQPWHFWKRLGLPLAFFVLANFLASFRQFSKHRTLLHIALAILIASSAARLTLAGLRVASFHKKSNPRIQLLAWLRSHTPPNAVIGTLDPQFILLIPALTTDYTYVPSGLRSLTPTAEIIDRFDELACLLKDSPGDVALVASTPNHPGHSSQLLQTLGLSFTGDPRAFDGFVLQYRHYLRHCHTPQDRLDYLILPTKQTAPPGFVPLFSNAAFRLFQAKRE